MSSTTFSCSAGDSALKLLICSVCIGQFGGSIARAGLETFYQICDAKRRKPKIATQCITLQGGPRGSVQARCPGELSLAGGSQKRADCRRAPARSGAWAQLARAFHCFALARPGAQTPAQIICFVLAGAVLISGCSKSDPTPPPAALTAEQQADVDFAADLLSTGGTAGRFQGISDVTNGLCILDTALGDVYVWHGSRWEKIPSPLRAPDFNSPQQTSRQNEEH